MVECIYSAITRGKGYTWLRFSEREMWKESAWLVAANKTINAMYAFGGAKPHDAATHALVGCHIGDRWSQRNRRACSAIVRRAGWVNEVPSLWAKGRLPSGNQACE